MQMKSLLLIMLLFSSNENENAFDSKRDSGERNVVVKIEDDEYFKVDSQRTKMKTSNFIGVSYNKNRATWLAQRRSKNEKKEVANGTYKNEETAAHASDTLARKLIANGEKGHKLNFPDDLIEVHPKIEIPIYIGIIYNENTKKWRVKRWSKNEKKEVWSGTYNDEETAAHASDTLARKLIANGEKGHKLNFPDDDTELYLEKRSYYIGLRYNQKKQTWQVNRWSKNEKKIVYNGTTYKNEETAAHASDNLARRLIENGEKGHKLNFPDDIAEATSQKSKRKRQNNLRNSQNNKFDQNSIGI